MSTQQDKGHEAVILTKDEIRAIVCESVTRALQQLGVDVTDPIAMQHDFQHLREWRTSVEDIRRKSVLTLITIFITGLIAAIWIGVKSILENG